MLSYFSQTITAQLDIFPKLINGQAIIPMCHLFKQAGRYSTHNAKLTASFHLSLWSPVLAKNV